MNESGEGTERRRNYATLGLCSNSQCRVVIKESINAIIVFILLLEKFLQFDWLRAVVFQLNLKYPHVITYINFEISLVVFTPNITTKHAITYTNSLRI